MICKCGRETGADWKALCRICWKNRSPEEVRAQRQAKLDRRLARMESKADRLDKIAEQKTAVMKPYHGDIAFFTQPAGLGTPFGRRREKIINRYTNGLELHTEANELREKIEWQRRDGVRVKGDAEAKRQAEREARDKIFTIGSRVFDWTFGFGEIVRVNKKTYTIKFDNGSKYARDKSFIKMEEGKA